MQARISRAPGNHLWHFSATASACLLITALAIATTFFAVHHQRLDQQVSRSILTSRLLFENTEPTLESFKARAHTLIQVDNYKNATIINSKAEKIFEIGLPLDIDSIATNFKTKHRWRESGQVLTSQKININNQDPLWLLISIDTTYASLLNLQFLFISSLVLFATIIFSYLYHRKLKHNIFVPLDKLNEALSKQIKFRDINPITLNHAGIYEELAQQINESFSIQIEKEVDLRNGIESATQDLRESLETIEVHNIDLDLARKSAVEQNKLKSEFLKKTSQDLRTPLSGIIGFSELLRKTCLNVEQLEYIDTIEDSTKAMLTIVSDIHDFSRLESGHLHIDIKAVDIRRSIEETLVLQSPLANERDVTLYSSVDQDIPQSVLGDPLRIQQVLAKLVSNTIKFEHTSYIEVCVSEQHRNDEKITIDIVIRSDGSSPREFENWQTISDENIGTNKEFFSGVGMGLAIAKGVAQHMNGSVSFERNDETCKFTFQLNLDIDKKSKTLTHTIDTPYHISALVFSNNDFGYREVTSRLYELGIRNQRANSFSEIISIAQKLKDEAAKHSRYLPIAVIEAQTTQQTLDKIVLTQTMHVLVNELGIPTVVIAPTGKHEILQKALADIDTFITQHPLVSSRFKKGLMEQLGIIKLKKDKKLQSYRNSSQPMKILVVDDNPANLKLASALLSDFNTTTQTAMTGQAAIREFKSKEFDLIFMDIQLPDYNGYEVTQKIRELEHKDKRTPIVALTAHNIEEEKVKLLLAGMDDCIEKPLTLKNIGTTLDRWIINTKNKLKPKSHEKAINPNKLTANIDSNPDGSSDIGPVNISECLNLTKNDATLASDMLNMLIASLNEEMQNIKTAHSQADIEQQYELLHRMHGACCYCGVPKLKKICKQLDTQLKNKNTAQLDEQLSELYCAIEELLSWNENHDIAALFDING